MRKKLLFLTFFVLISSFSFAKINKTDKLLFNDNEKVFYDGNRVILSGFEGNGKINIYSIIGNKIKSTEVIDLSSAIVPLNLIKGNMYIIQVNYLSSKIKTFKIIAL